MLACSPLLRVLLHFEILLLLFYVVHVCSVAVVGIHVVLVLFMIFCCHYCQSFFVDVSVFHYDQFAYAVVDTSLLVVFVLFAWLIIQWLMSLVFFLFLVV